MGGDHFQKIQYLKYLSYYFSYNICIRQAAGFNCVKYTPCSDTNSFTLSSTIIDDGMLGTTCALDWIEVAGAMGCGQTGILGVPQKLCGLAFNPLFTAMTVAESAGTALCGKNKKGSLV